MTDPLAVKPHMSAIRLDGKAAFRGAVALRDALHTAMLIVAAFILPEIAVAQPAPLFSYVIYSSTDTGCRFGMLTTILIPNLTSFTMPEMTATWSGECTNGSVSGPGRLHVMLNGNELVSFEGNMQEGAAFGVGTYRLNGKMTLAGSFQGGRLADGHVVISSENAFVYDGGWKDGHMEGPGTMKQANGNHYEGAWHNGKREGQGTFSWFRGNRYEGGWQAGEQSGHGTLVFADGGRFEGDWSHGELSGHGVQTYPSGARYDGEFKDGKRSGQGFMLMSNGDQLRGNWEDDVLNGTGSYISADGSRFDGNLHAGWPDGAGVSVAPNGRRYEGAWHDGLPNEEGTLTQVGALRYSGMWVNGCLLDAGGYVAFGMKPVSCPKD